VTLADLDRKRFDTARARAALRGITLHALESDVGTALYVATFHALTKSFADQVDLEAWLDRVDGKRVETAA
jgi:hypothetical protein